MSKNDDSNGMELSIWGGGWGLPSIDPESIQAMAAIRFGGAPGKILECNNPWNSPKGIIPFFKQLNSEYSYSAHDIGLYLRSKNFSADYGLTSIQCAETVAYGQLIWESLQVAYQYYCFVHEGNFTDVIRPFYGRRLPWVYKLWYPERLKRQAREIVTSMYRDAETQPDSVATFVSEKAKKCVQLLSEKLGTNEFFMGTSAPTTMDAIAFSYLAIFWKVQLAVNPVKDVITSCPNLERYLARLLHRYFPSGRGGISDTPVIGLSYGVDGEIVQPENSQLSGRQKLFAGLVASFAMLLYALKNGMVRMPGQSAIGSSQDEEDEEYWE